MYVGEAVNIVVKLFQLVGEAGSKYVVLVDTVAFVGIVILRVANVSVASSSLDRAIGAYQVL